MKKLNSITGIFIIGFSFICIACGTILPIQGNGDLVTSERNISAFEKIDVSGAAEVRYYISEEFRAVVTVDSNLDKYTEVYTINNVLHIGTKNGNYDFTKYTVEVYAPTLSGITVSGSGEFSNEETISTSTFSARVSGSGKINGMVLCGSTTSYISGSGKITLNGSSEDLQLDISGSGDFAGSGFNTKNASVKISGSGEAKINVTDILEARISGSGDLYYFGNPETDFNISGSGKIHKM